MPSHADKRKFDSAVEHAKRMKIEPNQNGINGFSVDSTETIDEERFFPIAVVGIGKCLIKQIPQCTCPISHNAPFRKGMYTFLF